MPAAHATCMTGPLMLHPTLSPTDMMASVRGDPNSHMQSFTGAFISVLEELGKHILVLLFLELIRESLIPMPPNFGPYCISSGDKTHVPAMKTSFVVGWLAWNLRRFLFSFLSPAKLLAKPRASPWCHWSSPRLRWNWRRPRDLGSSKAGRAESFAFHVKKFVPARMGFLKAELEVMIIR